MGWYCSRRKHFLEESLKKNPHQKKEKKSSFVEMRTHTHTHTQKYDQICHMKMRDLIDLGLKISHKI